MFRLSRALVALVLVAAPTVVGSALPDAPTASAASAPWTLPTSPPACTKAQADAGAVATCVITLGSGLPESRGWPAPPFPEPDGQTVATWVDLALGATGPTVAKVQAALDAKAGATIGVDGKFGSQTFNAVKAFQIAKGLKPATLGTVDKATAGLLGVQRMTGGTFPPKGWTWLGWGYNGATALARWEALFVSNAKPIGAIRAGGLRAMPDALPLFVGFYTEIQARGYTIHDGGTYVFRCTASTRKDCAGLGRYALSNHAYGLASDINTALNPMKRYVASSTASTACAVPVTTDMPHWVIQTAEKWGLYWGGYAWSSGCQSPTTARTSVTRDPMHFEFNGSPAQARAILKRVSSMACIDVVSAAGATSLKCFQPGEAPAAATRIAVTTTPPTGATAALVSLTTLGATTPGSLTLEDCAARPAGARRWVNASARVARSTMVTTVVPLDAKHRFCTYQSSAFHVVIDVQGYFSPAASAPTGNLFTPIAPARLVDSATQTTCGPDGTCTPPGPLVAGDEVSATVASPLSPVAALAHVTVRGATKDGYVSMGSCSNQPAPIRRTSATFSAADTAFTAVGLVRPVVTDLGVQFCTVATQQVQETVDVTGFFAPAAAGGLGFTAQTPARQADTTKCWTDPVTSVQRCNQVITAGNVLRLKAPTGASVVLVNVTATGSTATVGTVDAAACATYSVKGFAAPVLQVVPGAATSSTVAVPVAANGTYCVRTSTPTHLAVDLLGTFSAAGDLRYVPVNAVRSLDTRRKA